MAIVSESHLVIHTWPEHGYGAVDIFTCGAPRDPQAAVGVLRERYRPERIQLMEINRGLLDGAEHEPDVKVTSTGRAHRRSRAPVLSA
jgi:S-adenosylmethionine/arginine decarboxylase-like enzyme